MKRKWNFEITPFLSGSSVIIDIISLWQIIHSSCLRDSPHEIVWHGTSTQIAYLESFLWNFGVFIVKVNPLLNNSADNWIHIVYKLEARHISLTFLKFSQVNVHKALEESNVPKRIVKSVCNKQLNSVDH